MSLRKILEERRTLILREPLVKRFFGGKSHSQVELCKNLVDSIDTPRVTMFEALEHLSTTKDYKRSAGILKSGIEKGLAIAHVRSKELGDFGRSFLELYKRRIEPDFRHLLRMYEERADIDEIEEETFKLDSKMYDLMFEKFRECIRCTEV